MIERQVQFYRRINTILDLGITVVSYVGAFYIREVFIPLGSLGWLTHYLVILGFILVLWNILMKISGLYPAVRVRKFQDVVWIIVRTVVMGIGIIIIILYVFKIVPVSRIFILGFGVINVALLILKEFMARKILEHLRKKGINIKRALIISSDFSHISHLHQVLAKNNYLGLNIVGVLSVGDTASKEFDSTNILGSVDNIEAIIHTTAVDLVIISVSGAALDKVERVIGICEIEGIEIWLLADMFHSLIARTEATNFFGLPVLVFRSTPPVSWQLFFKSIFDYSGAAVLFVLLLPVLAVAAAAVKFTSLGPVLFRQKRTGLYGRVFTLYKFRTMVPDAEKMQNGLEKLNIMAGPAFKLKHDPRLTPVGKFLRKTSIDELPQLLNVLFGQMSLVGPRPYMVEQVKQFKSWQRRRLSMKPGITGLAQINGRSQIIDFDKLAEFDLKYIDQWSLWFDFKILMKTIPVAFLGIGAE